jgi:hypothetical protein
MKAAKKPLRQTKPKVIYQLRVALEEIEPSIWRRLWVADTLTLAKLDRVIQTAMGWTNSHLHEFTINGLRYGMPDDEWASEGDETMLDDRRHTIGGLLGTEVAHFAYLYDFGDHWQHTVAVEQLMLPNEMNTRAMCLDGRNACPPEDVGGVGGYMEFLEAIRDPTHDEHVAMWQWGGGPFDSTGFDRNATNAALRKLRL